MKFYVASSFTNIESVKYICKGLKSKGFIHTYDWTQNGRGAGLAQLESIGIEEKNAVMDADIVIILLPAGKGSHIEMGIALGTGKKVVLYSPDESIYDVELTSTFYHLPEVERFVGSLDDLTEAVVLMSEQFMSNN